MALNPWVGAVAVGAVLLTMTPAEATTLGTSKVTIAAEGTDMHGVLKSNSFGVQWD